MLVSPSRLSYVERQKNQWDASETVWNMGLAATSGIQHNLE